MITLVCSLLLAQEWEYHQEFGFVDRSTMDKKTPPEFLQHALSEREKGRYGEGLRALDLILRHVPDAALRESAQFERAGTFFKAGGYYEAYHEYETFILRFPQSERVTSAKRMEMTSALELAKVGKKGFLGIMGGSKTGVDYLRDALRRYPREDFSSDFNQKLGMFFYERADYDPAAEEFARVLDLYAETPDAVLALFMLGRTSEVRFESVDYDMKPLREARRQYERFLEEADRMRRLPDPARRWVDSLVPAVRERLAKVYGFMLEKQLKTAEYYDWKDAPRSARLYYLAILKEEESFRKVLRDFPESAAARKARARLAEKK